MIRVSRTAIVAAIVGLMAALGGAGSAQARPLALASPTDAAPVGWATLNGGTDGGADAGAASTYVVSDRAGLLAALDNHGRRDEPKIIYIKGTIHGNQAADGTLLGEQDYAQGYSVDKYLSCFGPDGWSDQRHAYCKDQRHLRQNGSNALKRQIEVDIPSNTTILGLGSNAGFRQTYLVVHSVHNVVIRNVTIEAPLGYFTVWDPNDGDEGSWNARFDALSSITSTNIWVDHVTFTDGRFPDSSAPIGPNGEPVNYHDGLFDIKDGSDYITVTNSRFLDHDKTMLIGSGDDNGDTDAGHLRVTLAGNYFDGACQRSPRVRFGEVHVLNNYFTGSVNDPVSPMRSEANGGFCYFIGLGYESAVVAQSNAIDYTGPGADASIGVRNWNATDFVDEGSWYKGQPVNLHKYVPDLGTDVGWDPAATYAYTPMTSYASVKWHGKHASGAGTLDVRAPQGA